MRSPPLTWPRLRLRRGPAATALLAVLLAAAITLLFLPDATQAQPTVDFGDAPAPYPTRLADNGARHTFNPDLRFGLHLDLELDGQPNVGATGDDIAPAGSGDDEDGVNLLTALVPGTSAQVQVVVTATGRLDAWIDFNQDGDWADAGEKVFTNTLVATGPNTLNFNVPTDAKLGTNAYSRWRLSFQGGLNFTGASPQGEVEDYQWTVGAAQELDFGDAPRVYQTVLAENGARHLFSPNLHLGNTIDFESDGQANSTATGDDNSPPGSSDDEDGVVFGVITAGTTAGVQVFSSGRGALDAWMDFNADGDWTDPGEQIFVSVIVNTGLNTLTFPVPANAIDTTNAFTRFRLSAQGGLPSFGPAPNGEVEDYKVPISSVPFDFGDAPDQPYPTLFQNDGARHRVNVEVRLGNAIDSEPNGQPNANATGDDLPSASDDEDGVTFLNPIVPGQVVNVQVVASMIGRLDAWIDFNGNGSWADAGDQVFANAVLNAGINTLAFTVPPFAKPGATFSRFRYSRQGGLSFTGAAIDGEVEDYQVTVSSEPPPCDRTNKGTDFWLTFPGNYAPDPDNPLKVSLCIVGPANTTGTVSMPGIGFSQNFVIPPTMEITINLPTQADLGDSNDLVTTNGIHVTASGEVAVFGMNRVRWTSDGYLGLPSDVLGTDYIMQGFGNVHTGAPDLTGSQFALVACDDGTIVAITPPINVLGHPANTPFFITLNRGQTYQLRSTNDAPADLSGTFVRANKPIAAFGSHKCANIPNNTVWFCDYIVEQLLPEPRGGTNFVAMSLATRSNATYRVQALQNSTTVRLNGGIVAMLNRGQSHQMTVPGPVHITSDRPVLVSQYSNSSDYDLVENSDPFMVVIPATKLFLTQYMVCTPNSDFTGNFINLVVPTAAVGSIGIDGVPVVAALYSPIPGSGYSGARVPTVPGAHNIGSVGPATVPFGVVVYGYAQYDSYGYPGGMFFTDVTPPTVTCLATNVTINPNPSTPCQGTVPSFTQNIEVTDNCPLPSSLVVTQNPQAGSQLPVGMHDVTVFVTDAAGNVGSCTVKLTIVDNFPPVLNCPQQIVTNCVTRAGTRVSFTVPTGSQCGTTNHVVVCQPESGSLFPPGTTVVTCQASSPGGTSSCQFNVTVRCLTIDRGPNGTVIISWTGGGTLEGSPTMGAGTWQPMTGGSPKMVTPTGTTRFFRVGY